MEEWTTIREIKEIFDRIDLQIAVLKRLLNEAYEINLSPR